MAIIVQKFGGTSVADTDKIKNVLYKDNDILSSEKRINEKLNNDFLYNEYFENAFADFDFNSEDKVKRKLSNDEFKYVSYSLLILSKYFLPLKE